VPAAGYWTGQGGLVEVGCNLLTVELHTCTEYGVRRLPSVLCILRTYIRSVGPHYAPHFIHDTLLLVHLPAIAYPHSENLHISLSVGGSLVAVIHLYRCSHVSVFVSCSNLHNLPRSFATSATVTQLRAIHSFLLAGHYDLFVAGKTNRSGDGAP
jgi:hypothetical protein